MPRRYQPNEQVGDYTIVRYISSGQFAICYEAASPDGKKVFLKQYKSPTCTRCWYGDYKAYLQEVAKRISSHPELALRTYRFIEQFEYKSALFCAVEFLDQGKDLRARLQEDEKPSPEDRYIFASLLLYTLHLFHGAGIVHTDLKPENLYLKPTPALVRCPYNLKLIDFDFPILDQQSPPWSPDLVLDKYGQDDGENPSGTPRYMSPEHLTGSLPLPQSDVFTAAIICCELLTEDGHPFPEDESDYREAVLGGSILGQMRFVCEESPALERLREMLRLALSSDIQLRPTAAELHAALLNCRQDFTSSAGQSKQPSSPNPKHPQRLGLSMKGGDSCAWFDETTVIGAHTPVAPIRDFTLRCSSCQFTLEANASGWRILPPESPPKNRTLVNGRDLESPLELNDGDELSLASRRKSALGGQVPVTVHLPRG